MTREETLAYALRKKAGLESEINKSNCGYGNWVMYSAELEFTNACISALKGPTREQVENVWKGKWEPGNPICPICGKDKFDELDADIWADWMPNFCPHCGAPMTDKAVDMVMERLERLRDG